MERIESAEGIIVSFEKYGSGPPLVLVHGSISEPVSCWMMVKPMLSPKFTVYAIARRGRGETTATEGHTIPEEAKDIVAVIESVGGPVYLLGHSFGAQVALAAASLLPENVRKMVLYEPPLPSAVSIDVLSEMRDLAAKGNYDQMIATFLVKGPKVPEPQVQMLRQTPFWDVFVSDAVNSVREFPALKNYDFDPARFSGLQIPTLLITGTDSDQATYATDLLAEALPDVEVVRLAGQAHAAHAMAPQVFVDTVTAFLAS